MGRKKISGLIKRGGIWHIDKQFRGRRLCESTGETDLENAELYLAQKLDTVRRAAIYGERPERSFRQAATKYINENLNKRSMENQALHLRQLDPFIGDLPLRGVHMGTVQPFIAARRTEGVKHQDHQPCAGRGETHS